jgi:hypothetical protein
MIFIGCSAKTIQVIFEKEDRSYAFNYRFLKICHVILFVKVHQNQSVMNGMELNYKYDKMGWNSISKDKDLFISSIKIFQ